MHPAYYAGHLMRWRAALYGGSQPAPPCLAWDKVADTYQRLGGAAGRDRSYFDSIMPFAGMRRCNLSDDGTVIAYWGEPGYRDDGSNGQVMVEVPKFWHRTEVLPSGYRWNVSPVTVPGLKLHPNWFRHGKVLDKVYIGAYKACRYDVSEGAYVLDDAPGADFTVGTGDKLSSIAGAKPISGTTDALTLPNARKLANNRGPGWGLVDFLSASAVQLLMLVEYGSFNSQQYIGRGIVDVNSGTGNMAMPTGQTATLGNASGAATGNVHPETGQAANSISYRGLEDWWGNIWEWTDGINIKDNRPWVADHDYQSDLFGPPYEDAGVTLPAENGYAADIAVAGAFDYGFLPSAVGASATTKLCDYYYQSLGNRIARRGGCWGNGSDAGPFCWYLSSASSYRGRSVGARLLYVGGSD